MQHQPHQKINLPQDFQQQYRIPFQKIKQWKQYLAENGFVVVKNFLQKQTCQEYMNDVWAMMEKLSLGKLKRDDIETQKISKNYPSSHHGGLMQYIGHAKFQWQLRKLTRPIFEELWQDKQLKCSFDGVTFSNGIQNFPFQPQNEGLHVDQPPIKKGIWSYQGIMALTDAGNHGGGFVCVPKSHLYFEQYFKETNMQAVPKARWIQQQDRYKQPLCNYIKVNSQAGDFILFDSRTFHCGCPPSNHNLRVVTYICMMPTKKVPPKVQQERLKAFNERMNSGHHCGDGFRTFPRIPKKVPKKKEELQQFSKVIYQLNQVGIDDLENDKQVMALV